MTNTLTRQIVVKNINGLLKGNIFTSKNITEDYPEETISYGFGQLNYSSDYNHKFTKRTAKELALMDAEFDKMDLPF